MRIKHTPAPWELKANHPREIMGRRGTVDYNRVIAQTFGSNDEAEANALLISKAPTMANVLAELVRAYKWNGEIDLAAMRKAEKILKQLEAKA